MGYTVKSKQDLESIQTLTGNPIALDNVRGSIGRILASREEDMDENIKTVNKMRNSCIIVQLLLYLQNETYHFI